MTNKELIAKCIRFYIDYITDKATKCPTVDEMREIVQCDDIIKGLEKKAE